MKEPKAKSCERCDNCHKAYSKNSLKWIRIIKKCFSYYGVEDTNVFERWGRKCIEKISEGEQNEKEKRNSDGKDSGNAERREV